MEAGIEGAVAGAGAGLGRKGRLAAAGAALLALGAAAGFVLLRDAGPGRSAADGSYYHDCCGTVALSGGRMLLGETKSVGYVVGEDEAGAFVLPDTFVGTWEDRGFEVDGSRPPLKLRLDKLPRPGRIVLPALRGTHTFTRKPPRARPKPAA